MTLRIGLTGGIGAGKTMVARIFENMGSPVFNADQIARKLVTENVSLKEKIVHAFGAESFKGNVYNTSYISGIVFYDAEKLQLLNSIVHPYVHDAFMDWCTLHHDNKYVLKEAALLLQSGTRSFFDYIIVVSAPVHLRIKRVVERDSISPEQISKRISSQLPEEKMLTMADFVIKNGENDLLVPQVLDLHNKFVSLWKEKH